MMRQFNRPKLHLHQFSSVFPSVLFSADSPKSSEKMCNFPFVCVCVCTWLLISNYIKQSDSPMAYASLSASSSSAAAAVPAGQPDGLQKTGDPKLQEGQRGRQQQDEVRQVGAIQHHRGGPLHPGGVLHRCRQEAAHPD